MGTRDSIFLAILTGVVLLFLYWITFGSHGLMEVYQMSQEKDRAQGVNDKLRKENAELERTVVRLRQDPGYIESVARKDLKMVGKDEVVFQFNREVREAQAKLPEKPK